MRCTTAGLLDGGDGGRRVQLAPQQRDADVPAIVAAADEGEELGRDHHRSRGAGKALKDRLQHVALAADLLRVARLREEPREVRQHPLAARRRQRTPGGGEEESGHGVRQRHRAIDQVTQRADQVACVQGVRGESSRVTSRMTSRQLRQRRRWRLPARSQC